MSKTLKLKIAALASLVIFALITLLPSFYKGVPDWWKKYLAPEGLRLGLDLQGGMHLVLRVDLEKAIENSLDLAAQNLKDTLAEKKISVVRSESGDPHKVLFIIPNKGALQTVQEVTDKDFSDLSVDIKAEEGGFPKIYLALKNEEINRIKNNAVGQSLEIIRNRIDQFGVAEPVIVRQGTDEIVVQLPGVRDPKRAMSLIGQTAQLEFKLVSDDPGIDVSGLVKQAESSGLWRHGDSRKALNLALQKQLPEGTEIYFEKRVNPQTKKEEKIPILLKNQVLLTGEMVKDAQVRIGGNFNEPYVGLDLTDRGGKVFDQVTAKNVNKRLAIALDESVRSAPVIRERISGGSAQISGNFTHEEAADLAIVLRAGALPAPVSIIQNVTVGPSLGLDSIQKGVVSGLLGTAMVVGFMLVYYRVSGLIANFALLLNILFLLAALAAFKATLTLPGIAGIILSIGMAVDSNVLIFERMRDEFSVGKTVRSGVEGGFNKALWTVVDSHVTTLITSFALFLFGTGPIKGFAVTLSLGVIFNLFTALFGTRIVYDVLYSLKRLRDLHFMQFFPRPHLDYMRLRHAAFVFSGFLSVIGLVAFVQIARGKANLGVDFTGGTLVQYQSGQPFGLDEVRKVLVEKGMGDLELQQVVDENRLIIKMKKSEETVGNVEAAVSSLFDEQLKEKNFVLESKTEIGASVSDVLRQKALIAVGISFLGIIGYLAFRFDLAFGVAAAIATFHDVLAVLGICYLLNVEITLLIITALLTLAGYSLTDTVVVFDRIRENIRKTSESSLSPLINQSINEVLSRTVVTSLTVFLAVFALWIMGGVVIHDFSFALLVGVIIGTYSSIFVASPVLCVWRKDKIVAM